MEEPEWSEEEEAYLVSNLGELNWIRNDLKADYLLVNDIDASETKEWDDGKGWKPIGGEGDDFTGTFDGQNHEINDLYINRPDGDPVGLIGRLANEGVIVHVGVSVEVYGETRVGGLVGISRGVVSDSYAVGKTSGEGKHIGGLVGYNMGRISRSYASVDVTGGERVGGLVGKNISDSDVVDSYATGDVSGERMVGGLVGYNFSARDRPDGRVRSSYATGAVSGEDGVGGLVGKNTRSNVSNSYWDLEASGRKHSDCGTGLTTSEMTGDEAAKNMDGFDFEETWRTVEEDDRDFQQDSYPILQGKSEVDDTSDDEYDERDDSEESEEEKSEADFITYQAVIDYLIPIFTSSTFPILG